ncbi:hypothetical protein AC579_8835 [Pseudocercospora musae]|uniref:Uncharacterized protein n=1 Tax=Pseudocercospora musae TaxID=113226 RepID=A0A139HDP6_9PEZI|nr:hypothetical protein AC579_8835 [Pseudocercospora musae]
MLQLWCGWRSLVRSVCCPLSSSLTFFCDLSAHLRDKAVSRGVVSPALDRWLQSRSEYEYGVQPLIPTLQSVVDLSTVEGTPDDFDSDIELEMEMTHALLICGKQKLADGEEREAERLLRSCLAKLSATGRSETRSGGPSQALQSFEAVDKLLEIYVARSDWTRAQTVLEQRMVIRAQFTGKHDAGYLKDVLQLATLLQHKGDTPAAQVQARKALKGFKRLRPPHNGVIECLSVLERLSRASGQEDDAEAFSIMPTGVKMAQAREILSTESNETRNIMPSPPLPLPSSPDIINRREFPSHILAESVISGDLSEADTAQTLQSSSPSNPGTTTDTMVTPAASTYSTSDRGPKGIEAHSGSYQPPNNDATDLAGLGIVSEERAPISYGPSLHGMDPVPLKNPMHAEDAEFSLPHTAEASSSSTADAMVVKFDSPDIHVPGIARDLGVFSEDSMPGTKEDDQTKAEDGRPGEDFVPDNEQCKHDSMFANQTHDGASWSDVRAIDREKQEILDQSVAAMPRPPSTADPLQPTLRSVFLGPFSSSIDDRDAESDDSMLQAVLQAGFSLGDSLVAPGPPAKSSQASSDFQLLEDFQSPSGPKERTEDREEKEVLFDAPDSFTPNSGQQFQTFEVHAASDHSSIPMHAVGQDGETSSLYSKEPRPDNDLEAFVEQCRNPPPELALGCASCYVEESPNPPPELMPSPTNYEEYCRNPLPQVMLEDRPNIVVVDVENQDRGLVPMESTVAAETGHAISRSPSQETIRHRSRPRVLTEAEMYEWTSIAKKKFTDTGSSYSDYSRLAMQMDAAVKMTSAEKESWAKTRSTIVGDAPISSPQQRLPLLPELQTMRHSSHAWHSAPALQTSRISPQIITSAEPQGRSLLQGLLALCISPVHPIFAQTTDGKSSSAAYLFAYVQANLNKSESLNGLDQPQSVTDQTQSPCHMYSSSSSVQNECLTFCT